MFVEEVEEVEITYDYDELYQAVYDENIKVMNSFFDKNYYVSQLVSHKKKKFFKFFEDCKNKIIDFSDFF